MYNLIYKGDIMQSVVNSVMAKKELAYNVYLFYGQNLNKMDCNENQLFFESGSELCSYIKEEIENAYVEYKDTFCKGLPLVLVTLEIINSDAVIWGDDFPEEAVCDLTIFDPNKSANELIEPHEDLLKVANEAFHSYE